MSDKVKKHIIQDIISDARAYYNDSIENFIEEDCDSILGKLASKSQYDINLLQNNAWKQEISILKNELSDIEGNIIFEYTIPRMGKRIDVVVISGAYIFLLEFKVGEKRYPSYAIKQVCGYASDLQNFHEESHYKILFPLLICTDAPSELETKSISIKKMVADVQKCNANNLNATIKRCMNQVQCICNVNVDKWINSKYAPTPTIIEAAQALFNGHNVKEISHNASLENDFENTINTIDYIINDCKSNNRKAICFVTGVPGAGKTLVGLKIANKRHDFDEIKEEHAVFLSGNEPLITVLSTALVNDQIEKKKRKCCNCKEEKRIDNGTPKCVDCPYNFNKDEAKELVKSFIQMVHWFRDESLNESHKAPVDRIAIFDEAQRAWSRKKLSTFMKTKKNYVDFEMSEPECLIEYMNRHKDWACIICLVGGGQEIYDGEAGITEWFSALNNKFTDWQVYYSNGMNSEEYLHNDTISSLLDKMEYKPIEKKDLHLYASMRSYKSEYVAQFAEAIINNDPKHASELLKIITQKDSKGEILFPIYLTRDLNTAKSKIQELSTLSDKYGIIASSRAKRLRADGIVVPKDIKVENWFLNEKEDVDSSYMMEVAASEYKIQGLEIDFAIVAWEGDYRYKNGNFEYFNFIGSKWNLISDENTYGRRYLKNTYRVLLTRSRQGYIIYVPKGNTDDITRLPDFYDETYEYLKSIGIEEIV